MASHCSTSRPMSCSSSSALAPRAVTMSPWPCATYRIDDAAEALALGVVESLEIRRRWSGDEHHDRRERHLLGEPGAFAPIGFLVTWHRMV